MTDSQYEYNLPLTHNELVVLSAALQSYQTTLYKVLIEQVPNVPYAPTRQRVQGQFEWEQQKCSELEQRLEDLTDQ